MQKTKNMKIEYINTIDLIPYANNAKIHDEIQIEQIKQSIKSYGFNDPVAVWKNNEIIEGHGRVLAAKDLGIEQIPIIRLENLSDKQRREYMLVHNQLTMNTGFDAELLDAELQELDFDEFDYGFEGINEVEETETEINENLGSKNDEFFYFKKEDIQRKVYDNWLGKKFSLDEFVSFIIDEPTAMYQFNRLCQGYNDGYNISLLFNPHRLCIDTLNDKNIFNGFNNDDVYKKQFARYMVNFQKVVPIAQYYKYIGIGSAGYQYVNEFQPYLARDIYKRFCNSGYKILNPCGGWGGRLIGLASCMLDNIEFIQAEPATATYNGLCKLKTFLRLNDDYKTYNLPFEDLQVKENYFDFVFTSPPYFNTEKYSDENTQSYKQADNYKSWLKNWFYPFVDKILYSMKPKAKCLLNVGNARYPMETDLKKYLKLKDIKFVNLHDFKIGGSGIGSRTGEKGEPFVLFEKC